MAALPKYHGDRPPNSSLQPYVVQYIAHWKVGPTHWVNHHTGRNDVAPLAYPAPNGRRRRQSRSHKHRNCPPLQHASHSDCFKATRRPMAHPVTSGSPSCRRPRDRWALAERPDLYNASRTKTTDMVRAVPVYMRCCATHGFGIHSPNNTVRQTGSWRKIKGPYAQIKSEAEGTEIVVLPSVDLRDGISCDIHWSTQRHALTRRGFKATRPPDLDYLDN